MEADGMQEEMWRAYELVGKLQSHIIHSSGGGGSGSGGSPVGEKELAGFLCQEALQSCDVALSQLINDHQYSISFSPSPSTSPPSSSTSPLLPSSPSLMSRRDSTPPPARSTTPAGGHGRKRVQELEEKLTISPFEDGHHWRKYGEKQISGTDFRRCYYRCSYKEDKNCQAKMRMQQRDNQNPPMYLVTYDKKHTCNVRSLDHAPIKLSSVHLTLPQAEPFHRLTYCPDQFVENKKEKSSNMNFVKQFGYTNGGSNGTDLQCDSSPIVKQDGLSSPCLNTSSGEFFDAEDHFQGANFSSIFSSSINLQQPHPPTDLHSLVSNVEMVDYTASTPMEFSRELTDEEIQELLGVLI